MVRAVITNGAIVPIEPLPKEWFEGKEVGVADFDDDAATDVERLAREADEWFLEMQDAVSRIRPEDADALMAALDEVERESKEIAGREERSL